MTETPLDLDAISRDAEAFSYRDAWEGREYLDNTGAEAEWVEAIDTAMGLASASKRLVAALRDAQAEVEAAREAHDRAVTRGIAHVDRAERAEAQVAAMLALCDTGERQHRVVVTITSVRAAVDGAS